MSEKPTGAELFLAYMPSYRSQSSVATMSLNDIEYQVRKVRRSKKTPEQWQNLPLQDGDIAQSIRDYARGMGFTRELRTPAEKLLLQIADRQWDILEAQTAQSEYLKRINDIVQLIGLLILLSLIAGCLLAVLGGSSFF